MIGQPASATSPVSRRDDQGDIPSATPREPDHGVVYSSFPLAPARQSAGAHRPVGAAAEGTVACPGVDPDYYLATYPDVRAAGRDPTVHWQEAGWRERRNPNSWFDTAYYLATNPDVADAGLDPLAHFLDTGRAEGRAPARRSGFRRAVLDALAVPRADTAVWVAPDSADHLLAHDLERALTAALARARGLVVSVSHDRYLDVTGGTQAVIADEQAKFNGDRVAYLQISPAIARIGLAPDGSEPAFWQVVLDGAFLGLALADTVESALGDLAEQPTLPRVLVVHHLDGHAPERVARLSRVGRFGRAIFWLHDYASVCPGRQLLRNNVAFCHAPPPESLACRVCIHGVDRASHRGRMRALFEAVAFDVLAPSATALALWEAAADLPHRSASVHPHLELITASPLDRPPSNGPARIAFVGRPAEEKGWPLFREVAALCGGDPSLRLYHFAGHDHLAVVPGITNVAARTTPGDRAAMMHAIRSLAIDIVLLLSPWPETFSFVAHEALCAGADVVTLAVSGYPAQLVESRGRGVVLASEADVLAFLRDGRAAAYVACRRSAPAGALAARWSGTSATWSSAPQCASAITADPDIQIWVHGARITVERDGRSIRCAVPGGTRDLRLRSRSCVPAGLYVDSIDHRRLGIAVASVALDGMPVPFGDARFGTGWHAPETGWAWTDGDAAFDPSGAAIVEFVLSHGLDYWRTWLP